MKSKRVIKKGKLPAKEDFTPLVKSLSGVLKLSADFDYKEDRSKFLEKKYK